MKHGRDPLALGLSTRQLEQLQGFANLLQTWGPKLGLIGSGDRDRIWERHILDSLRAIECVPRGVASLVDVGSGPGLPGIPVAIALPAARMVLLEPKRRRAAFMELAVEELSLRNVSVVTSPASAVHETFQVVMARALAPVDQTWSLAGHLVAPGGVLLYFAGASWIEAERGLSVEGVTVSECFPSRLESEGPIVMIRRGEGSRTP